MHEQDEVFLDVMRAQAAGGVYRRRPLSLEERFSKLEAMFREAKERREELEACRAREQEALVFFVECVVVGCLLLLGLLLVILWKVW